MSLAATTVASLSHSRIEPSDALSPTRGVNQSAATAFSRGLARTDRSLFYCLFGRAPIREYERDASRDRPKRSRAPCVGHALQATAALIGRQKRADRFVPISRPHQTWCARFVTECSWNGHWQALQVVDLKNSIARHIGLRTRGLGVRISPGAPYFPSV